MCKGECRSRFLMGATIAASGLAVTGLSPRVFAAGSMIQVGAARGLTLPVSTGTVPVAYGEVRYILVQVCPVYFAPCPGPFNPNNGAAKLVFQVGVTGLVEGDSFATLEPTQGVDAGMCCGRVNPYAQVSMGPGSVSGPLTIFREATTARISGANSTGFADTTRGITVGESDGNHGPFAFPPEYGKFVVVCLDLDDGAQFHRRVDVTIEGVDQGAMRWYTGIGDQTCDEPITATNIVNLTLDVGQCDSIDFNNDAIFPDSSDIADFLSVFGGGPCSNDPNCGDTDFNNDGIGTDPVDIEAFLSVYSGGPCL